MPSEYFEAQVEVAEDSARSAWQHVRRVQNDKKINSGKRSASYRYPPAHTHTALFSCRYECTHTLVVTDARAITTQEAGLDLLQLLRPERIRRASLYEGGEAERQGFSTVRQVRVPRGASLPLGRHASDWPMDCAQGGAHAHMRRKHQVQSSSTPAA